AGVIIRYTQSSVINETQCPVRSIGAAARGDSACGGGAAGRCAAAGAAASAAPALSSRPASRDAVVECIVGGSVLRSRSVERLALEAPAEAVGRPEQAAHPDAMVDRIASRVTADDHVIAGLQRFARDALAGQLARAAPFHAPALHLAVL